MIGNIAVSIQGHDKGKAYIIIEEKDGYLYVSDGKRRSVDNPKKKNPAHLQINRSFDTQFLKEKIKAGEKIYDHDAVRIINLWKESISEGNKCQKQM